MIDKTTILRAAFVAGVFATSPAFAAKEFGNGNITAVDWNAMQIEIKTPKGRVYTYKVARNIEVKFTDGAADFPNPTYKDLAPPMQIHFTFEDQTILSADVREVGGAPRRSAQQGRQGRSESASSASSREIKIRISKIEDRGDSIQADVAGRNQSFRMASRDVIRGFREDDLVVATLERRNGREVITELKRSR
jgi:Cu/Ag efflux protein CusF